MNFRFIQRSGNSRRLSRTNYEFRNLVGSCRTLLLVSVRWCYGTCKIFSNALLIESSGPPRSSDVTPSDFYLWGCERESLGKQPEQIRRSEAKYSTVHFKNH